jgi:hypothetical protein
MTREEIAPWIGHEVVVTLIGGDRVTGTLLADSGTGTYPFTNTTPRPGATEAVGSLNATDIVKIEPTPGPL